MPIRPRAKGSRRLLLRRSALRCTYSSAPCAVPSHFWHLGQFPSLLNDRLWRSCHWLVSDEIGQTRTRHPEMSARGHGRNSDRGARTSAKGQLTASDIWKLNVRCRSSLHNKRTYCFRPSCCPEAMRRMVVVPKVQSIHQRRTSIEQRQQEALRHFRTFQLTTRSHHFVQTV